MGLFLGLASRGRASRDAIALLRGVELRNCWFAHVPDLLRGWDCHRYSLLGIRHGSSDQSAGIARRNASKSSSLLSYIKNELKLDYSLK